jgi:hypothetical protein
MILASADDELIARYLLGQLSPEEQATVERRLFTDDSFAERVSLLESELIDAYARADLPADISRRFVESFAATPGRQLSARLSAALAKRSRAFVEQEPGSAWARVAAFLRGPSGLRLSVAALAVIALIVFPWVLLLRQHGEFEKAQQELAAARAAAGVHPEPENSAPLLRFRLTAAELARTVGEGRTLSVPLNTPVVLFEIPTGAAGVGGQCRVAFETPTGEVRWSVMMPPGGAMLAVPVPTEALPEDDYIVRLQTRRGDSQFTDVASYTFTLLTY